jgi:hypothetical protein
VRERQHDADAERWEDPERCARKEKEDERHGQEEQQTDRARRHAAS